MTARILGIDLGTRRVGLAVADAGVGIARALTTLGRDDSPDRDAAALGRVCAAQEIVALVIGLPLEANGDEGAMARAARDWATAVGERLGLPVVLQDERLSSFEAARRVGRMPRGRSGGPPSPSQRSAHRARVDREAAAIILQDHLDSIRGVAPGRSGLSEVAGLAPGEEQ